MSIRQEAFRAVSNANLKKVEGRLHVVDKRSEFERGRLFDHLRYGKYKQAKSCKEKQFYRSCLTTAKVSK